MTDPHTEQRLETSQPCTVHRNHIPASHVNEIHHVWPKGHGGPDVAENRVVVCATGHNNIHRLMNEMLALRGKVPYATMRAYSFKERELATLGFQRIMRKSM